jgi:hypothetical protein
MSIANYIRPQSIIKQIFQSTPDVPGDRINAFIFGPAYHLQRYTNETEKAEFKGETFTGATQSLSYEKLPTASKVDLDFVKLYAEDMSATLATFDPTVQGAIPPGSPVASETYFQLHSLATPNKIRLVRPNTVGMGVKADATTTPATVLDPLFVGRDVQVGDRVVITDPKAGASGVRTRVVTAIENDLTDSTFGSNVDADDGLAAAYVTNPVLQATDDFTVHSVPAAGYDVDVTGAFEDTLKGPSFGGKYGDKYTITVTTGGDDTTARLSVRSNSGFYTADNVQVDVLNVDRFEILDPGNSIFKGLTVELVLPAPVVTLTKGHQYVFSTHAQYTPLALIGGDLDIIGSSGSYTGDQDTTYFIRVLQGSVGNSAVGAIVQVYDSVGVDQTLTHTITTVDEVLNLGNRGLTFKFIDVGGIDALSQPGLKAGDVYTVKAISAKAEAQARIVVLNGSAIDIAGLVDENYAFDKVEFKTVYSGIIEPERDIAPVLSWEASANSVDVVGSLALFVDGRTTGLEWVPFDANTGKLFVHYRSLLPSSVVDPIYKVSNTSDINTYAGKIDQENPQAFGLNIALSGSQGKPVFGANVSTNDQAGFNTVLKSASNRDDLYALVPMTFDTVIQDIVVAHVTAMSGDKEKKWRRAYLPFRSLETFAKLDVKSDDSNYSATVVDDGTGEFRRVITENADFVEAAIRPGDLFRVNYSVDAFNNPIYDSYVVAVVVSEEELILESGPAVAIVSPIKFEIWAGNTGLNQVERVASRSSSIGNRRAANVWVDSPEILINDDYVPLDERFVACEVAGLRSALLPQQGLTNTEITVVSRATQMFSKYTQDELDIAAAAGTFIITQDVRSGSIHIRHQLTTQTQGGSLFYEDNIGTSADEITYAIKDFVDPFIGRRNATPQTVTALKIGYENLLLARTVAPAFQDIGPQLLGIVPGTLVVEIDPVLKDQVNMGSTVEMPLPLNRVIVTQNFTQQLS